MVAESAVDLKEILAMKQPFRVVGGNTHAGFRLSRANDATTLEVRLSGIISHEVDDQVITCHANTPLKELQEELSKGGQCLPYLPVRSAGSTTYREVEGTVGGHLSMNLPHAYEGLCGTWKDWLLGAKVVLPNGLEGKSGSKAVKSVAGYDLHKFLIGARGTLGVLSEVTLRTLPVKALPEPDVRFFADAWPEQGFVQRTLAADFRRIAEESEELLLATQPLTSTLYLTDRPTRRGTEDWLAGWGFGEQNLEPLTGATRHFYDRAKSIFDPHDQLNPGEFLRV
jgi:glycolate oxidase FAD binding subunit